MRFLNLQSTSKIKQQLLDLVQTDRSEFDSNGFKIIMVPDKIIMADRVLARLKLKFKGQAIIFHMQPNTFYRFHTDQTRKCAINMLISGETSHCYYGDETSSEEVIDNVSELKYQDSRYYLLNTQLKHAVLNFNNHRYMLSLGFKDFDYTTIKNYCEENLL
jgi:hypothetical protein